MGQVSAGLRRVQGGYAHWCPACEGVHCIQTDAESGPRWTFDGNVDKPTFGPSVRITYNGPDADTRSDRRDGARAPSRCCHYFLIAGELRFCGDCSHELSGKTIPLPALPEGLSDGYFPEPDA
jgi:hypothetical protein